MHQLLPPTLERLSQKTVPSICSTLSNALDIACRKGQPEIVGQLLPPTLERLSQETVPSVCETLYNALDTACTQGQPEIVGQLLPDVVSRLSLTTAPTVCSTLSNALDSVTPDVQEVILVCVVKHMPDALMIAVLVETLPAILKKKISAHLKARRPDITLALGAKHFPAHKDVLEARSPFFRAAFSGRWKQGPTMPLSPDIFSEQSLATVIALMYGEEYVPPKKDLELEMDCAAADYLGISDLLENPSV